MYIYVLDKWYENVAYNICIDDLYFRKKIQF
jgi:hypothetical protein